MSKLLDTAAEEEIPCATASTTVPTTPSDLVAIEVHSTSNVADVVRVKHDGSSAAHGDRDMIVEDDAKPSDAQQRPSLGAATAVAKVGEEGNMDRGTSAVELATPSDPPACEVHSAVDVAYVGDVEHDGCSVAHGDMDAIVEDGVEPSTTQQSPSSRTAAGAAKEGEDGKTSTRPST